MQDLVGLMRTKATSITLPRRGEVRIVLAPPSLPSNTSQHEKSNSKGRGVCPLPVRYMPPYGAAQ